MGQGYSLTTLSSGSTGIDVPELADLNYEKSLGDARFMKTIRARHASGLVVAKAAIKPYSNMKFDKYIAAIGRERKLLDDIPNALPFHRAFETSTHGYLLRQYTYSSLYDRMSTRPFLEDVEKRWLSFQLLTAMKECHAKDIYHGDIKTENCLVTSWNWLFLSDFSGSFKPVYLPEDDPAEFSFYFDISGRRTCYLAPERFLAAGEAPGRRPEITWAMDIFSVGCVIAELFCEGPIFNLSQLFNYRAGDFDPMKEQISRIEDPDIRELVGHMIQLEPESRYSADEYLNFWRGKAFPDFFYSFLHQYMFLITDPSSGKATLTAEKTNLGECDDRIARVYHDFDKIAFFLSYDDSVTPLQSLDRSMEATQLFPLHVNLPERRRIIPVKHRNPGNDGTYLFLNIVTSSVRSTARASARLQACDLLLAFAQHVPDEAKLDRILPFVVTLLEDRSEVVKVAALRTLAQLLALVVNPSPVNAYIFPEYLMPRLSEILHPKRGKKSDAVIRVAYAQCIAPLASVAARFLDSIQALRREGSLPSVDAKEDENETLHAYQDYYDTAHADLIRFFEVQTRALLTDSDSDVKKAFLGSVPSLCLFFGSSKTSDAVLSHLNTYLNDRNWELKSAFFDAITGVAIYVGPSNLEDYILPLIVPALTDTEEFVVDRALRSLASMADLGLFQRPVTWDLIDLVSRYTIHPNSWIREAATSFLAAACKYLSIADIHCLVKPLVFAYLRMMPKAFSELDLLGVLKRPLPRSVYATALDWARRNEKGLFWRNIEKRFASTKADNRFVAISSRELIPNALQKMPKNDEDVKWVNRLREAGMEHEEEFKFLALSECIWRVNTRTIKDANGEASQLYSSQVGLEDSLLKEVSFDVERPDLNEPAPGPNGSATDTSDKPQTIADALLDASTTIGMSGDTEGRRAAAQPLPILHRSSTPQASSGSASNSKQNGEASPDRASSTGDGTLSRRQLQGASAMRHRASAMNLMQRERSGGKAGAEIGTTSENVFGRVDGNARNETMAELSKAGVNSNVRQESSNIEVRYKAGAGYQGRDPNVLKLLGSIYLDSTPANMAEFGASINPIEETLREEKSASASGKLWRPMGTMIATFSEHTAAIAQIVVAADHSFFITASEDGSVKLWDTSKLERNLSHRSRQTYRLAAGVKVTTLCFIGNSSSFAVAGSDGSVHIVRVDRSPDQSGMRYGKLRLIRQWHLSEAPASHAVWMECLQSSTSLYLLAATSNSTIQALDPRTGSILYTLENPVQHGSLKTLCIGPSPYHWLLVGTAHGVLDLWDLRFRLRLRSFAFPGAAPIHRICLHPAPTDQARGDGQSSHAREIVYISGGTGAADITAWDLQERKCVEVYRTASASHAHTQRANGGVSGSRRDAAASTVNVSNLDLHPYTPWDPDTVPRSSLLSRLGPVAATGLKDDESGGGQVHFPADRSCLSFAVGQRYMTDESSPPFLVAAGPGSAIRFWDLKDERSVGASCLVCGDENGDDEDVGAPVFEVAGRKNGTVVCEERYAQPEAEDGKSQGRDAKDRRRKERPKSRNKGLGREMLLQRHLDTVTAVTVIEKPYRMIVSGDRSGIVFVWS